MADTPEVKKRGTRTRKPSTTGTTPKTTGKKSSKAVVINANEEEARAQSDDENVVLNLRVFTDIDTETKDEAIEGYDCGDFTFSGINNYLDSVFNNNESSVCGGCDSENLSTNNYQEKTHALKVIDLLKDFEEKNKHNEWPSNTSIHCYWCCHKFNNTPFGIPVKYINNKFHVFGCFCSLECCAAYNMECKDSSDDVWERGSLINMLARKLGYKAHVKPAPNRLALKMFGGHLEIEEFRQYCNSSKIININFPPMMTMTQQIEEINESDINSDFRYIPLDTDRINKYKEKIKLKRNKPVTNFKNTLDHTMNLKYGGP